LRESLDRPSGDLTVPVVIAGQGGGPEAGLARWPPCFNWWQRWDIGCLLPADPRLVLPISEEKLIFLVFAGSLSYITPELWFPTLPSVTEDRNLEAAESVESVTSLPATMRKRINCCCWITWLVLLYLLGQVVLGLAVHVLCKEYYCF